MAAVISAASNQERVPVARPQETRTAAVPQMAPLTKNSFDLTLVEIQESTLAKAFKWSAVSYHLAWSSSFMKFRLGLCATRTSSR